MAGGGGGGKLAANGKNDTTGKFMTKITKIRTNIYIFYVAKSEKASGEGERERKGGGGRGRQRR